MDSNETDPQSCEVNCCHISELYYLKAYTHHNISIEI